jgi:hypothetical protein
MNRFARKQSSEALKRVSMDNSFPWACFREEKVMASQLGPIEICCDAPPYLIVQACQILRFHSPLDVRWSRMSHFLSEPTPGPRLWNFLFAKSPQDKSTCACGMPLPVLESYAFTFACGKVLNYSLAQCRKCRTIYWEEGMVPAYNEAGSRQAT